MDKVISKESSLLLFLKCSQTHPSIIILVRGEVGNKISLAIEVIKRAIQRFCLCAALEIIHRKSAG